MVKEDVGMDFSLCIQCCCLQVGELTLISQRFVSRGFGCDATCSLKGLQVESVLLSTELLTTVSEVYSLNIFLSLLPSKTVVERAADYQLCFLCFGCY